MFQWSHNESSNMHRQPRHYIWWIESIFGHDGEFIHHYRAAKSHVLCCFCQWNGRGKLEIKWSLNVCTIPTWIIYAFFGDTIDHNPQHCIILSQHQSHPPSYPLSEYQDKSSRSCWLQFIRNFAKDKFVYHFGWHRRSRVSFWPSN